MNEIKKTIFLIPNLNYDLEIKQGIKKSKVKTQKQYFYDITPTKLTKQIEKLQIMKFENKICLMR